MAFESTAKTNIYIDDKQAEEALKSLQLEVDKYTKKMHEAKKANDKAGFDKAKKEFNAAKKELRNYKSTVVDVTKVLNNLSGTSLNNLVKVQKKLERETKRMNKNTKEEIALYKQKVTQLNRVKTQTTKVRMEMNAATHASKGWMSSLANGFNKYSMVIMSFIASITSAIIIFRKAVDIANEFESSLSNLSALTGLAGKELDYLNQRALAFSGSTTEAGIRITKSAQDIIDAYTQMGSKRPELLKDKKALADVTEQAIILSQAAKMELVPATNALAISMNQLNASSKEAPRYVNAIAAGSKVGAGDVLYIAAALEKSGTAANMMGISIEEAIGTIETVAPKIAEATFAGRQLRNVFIRLQTGADKFNPAIVGLEKALENLGEANLSTAEITKMFGRQNLTAAQTLISSRDEYIRYRDAVTDTNVAVEQAIKNTSNNKAKLEAARASLNKVTIELGQKLAPALTFSTSSFSHLIKATLKSIKFFNEYKTVILSVTAGIITYTIAVNASMIKLRAYVLITNIAEKATKLFNLAVKSNPLGLVIGVITTAATAMYLYATRTKEAAERQIELNKAAKEGIEIWKNTKPIEERAAVIEKMNKQQLKRFIDNAKQQVLQINRLEELKLIAYKKWQDEKDKIDNTKTYSGIVKQQEAVKAAEEHYNHMTRLLKNANKEQLQSYIKTAEKKLGIVTDEKEKEKDIELDADLYWQEYFDKKLEGWEKENRLYWRKRLAEEKKQKAAFDKAMTEDGDWGDEEEQDVEEDPQLIYAMNLAKAEMNAWQESYEGRKAALEDLHKQGLISEEQYQEKLYNLNQESVNAKLQIWYNYIAAVSQATEALSMFLQSQKEKELKAAGDNEKKKEEIQKRYAEKEQFIASAQAQMRGAMAIMNLWGNNTLPYPAAAVFNGIMTGIIAATTMAQVALINSKQFAEGNYWEMVKQFALGNYMQVIGADDGRKYNAQVGNNQSRLVTQPTYEPGLGLVGEQQPELVFNNADTQKILNTPELIAAINATIGATPQYAAGNSSEIIRENTTVKRTFTDPALMELLQKVNDKLDQPAMAILVADEDYIRTHKEVVNEYDSFRKKVG